MVLAFDADDGRPLGKRDERDRHAIARGVDERRCRLSQLRQTLAHLRAVVDEKRDLQRIIVFGHAQYFAPLPCCSRSQTQPVGLTY